MGLSDRLSKLEDEQDFVDLSDDATPAAVKPVRSHASTAKKASSAKAKRPSAGGPKTVNGKAAKGKADTATTKGKAGTSKAGTKPGQATASKLVDDSPNGPGDSAREARLHEVRARTHDALVKALGPQLYTSDRLAGKLEDLVKETLKDLLDKDEDRLPPADRARLVSGIMDDILGHGPIESLLADPTVDEVMCNGTDGVYVERGGRLEKTDIRFHDNAHLRRTIERIVAQVGRRIDESSPYVDARLLDGSRVNAVIPPVSVDGPMLTIRKFAPEGFDGDDLVGFGTWTEQARDFLAACVAGKINVLVTGGTGAGKTTTLNVLSCWIGADERILTVEDAVELRLDQPHVIRLEYRPPNIEGKGEVTIRDLVRNALRMRPDRIVVGECRGGEALDMLQAMNTGHDGSISTVHCNSPRDALSRLETMVLMAGMELPAKAIREQIASAVQLIVHQSRMRDGSRRVTHVTEVTGMEGDKITAQDIFLFDHSAGVDDDGRLRGKLKPTGIRPKLVQRLQDEGVEVKTSWFLDDEMAGRKTASRRR